MKKKFLYFFGWLLAVSFVLINIYSSQTIHPLFIRLVNQPQKPDVILFLKKIKGTKEFSQQLDYFKNLYGEEIEKEVYAEEVKRREEIKKLEAILPKNPKARDVLVKLAILYFEDGKPNAAKDYYQKAKAIDPLVKIRELEKL